MRTLKELFSSINSERLFYLNRNAQSRACLAELRNVFSQLPEDISANFRFMLLKNLNSYAGKTQNLQFQKDLTALIRNLKRCKNKPLQISESQQLLNFFRFGENNYKKILTYNGKVVPDLDEYLKFFSFWRKALNPKGFHIDVVISRSVEEIFDEYTKMLISYKTYCAEINNFRKHKVYLKYFDKPKALKFSRPFADIFKTETVTPNPKFTAYRLTAISCHAFGVPINEKSVSDIVRKRK